MAIMFEGKNCYWRFIGDREYTHARSIAVGGGLWKMAVPETGWGGTVVNPDEIEVRYV